MNTQVYKEYEEIKLSRKLVENLVCKKPSAQSDWYKFCVQS